MAQRVAELERLLGDLERKIKSCSSSVPFSPLDAGAIVRSVTAQCGEVVGMLGDRSSGALKRVVETFVSRATFDVETRECEIEIGLPSWAVAKEQKVLEAVREMPHSVDETWHRTHFDDFISLARYTCVQGKVSRYVCVTCKRHLRAA